MLLKGAVKRRDREGDFYKQPAGDEQPASSSQD